MYLHRVEVAVAIEREANDMCGVLVAAAVQGIGHDVSDLRENLLNYGPVGAQADPLSELRSHMNHDTLTLPTHTPAFLLSPPAFQLCLQRSQLEETGLFVKQGVFLQTHTPYTPTICKAEINLSPLCRRILIFLIIISSD